MLNYQQLSTEKNWLHTNILCFMANRMKSAIEEERQLWYGDYFKGMDTEGISYFLQNLAYTQDTKKMYLSILLNHWPVIRVAYSSIIILGNGVDFSRSATYPGASPFVNAAENFGAIVKSDISHYDST